jgi:hypothetical protein
MSGGTGVQGEEAEGTASHATMCIMGLECGGRNECTSGKV